MKFFEHLHTYHFTEQGLWRGFATYRIDGNDRKKIETKLEIAWRKRVSVGFVFHFGNKGSETPVDVMLSVGFLAFFWSLNFPKLGAFCQWLGRGHKRNLSMKIHGGKLWWELWYDDDMGYDNWHNCDKWRKPKLWPWSMGRRKHRSWMCLRDGNIDLNPVTALWGWRYFHYHQVGKTYATLCINQFPGDEHELELRLRKQTRGREHGPKWARRREDCGWTVDWSCKKGIPVRNHDWKGDEILGSSERVDLTIPQDWVEQACLSLAARVEKDRIHYNYRPPKEESNAQDA